MCRSLLKRFPPILLCIVTAAFILRHSEIAVAAEKAEKETVIILHGIARSSAHMAELAEYLSKQGYDTHNIDYPSTKYPIEELAEKTEKRIADIADEAQTLHFVGHSMGGLLIRALLHRRKYPNLGRVVQLAPPNKGSEVADFMLKYASGLYGYFFGPAGAQLGTDLSRHPDLFGEVYYAPGVIAGDATFDPFSSYIIPGPDDGKVAVERTKIEGMADHITVHASHIFFPGNNGVMRQTAYFLREGIFDRD